MNLSAISHRIPLDTVYEDEASDSLSSEDFSQNFSPRSNKENNPYHQQQFTTDCDSETAVTSQTKKIRKKRTAYQKIDDDIRLQLWEAVQQNGESLKCAAKRLNINYSSAKSILHTYRKEGRILKKSALERTVKICGLSPSDMEITQFTLPPLSFNDYIPNKALEYPQTIQNLEVYQESTTTTNSYGENSPPSPMHGLADNLCQISLEAQDQFKELRLNDQISMPKPQLPSLRPINKPKLPLAEIINESSTHSNVLSPIIPAFRLPANHQPGNPLESLKHLDNFYMNYSNSPLSGGNNKMFQECSDSGSRNRYQKEFDSFSDMVNCFQSQPRPVDEAKGDIPRPKPLKLNTMQIIQEKLDAQMAREESPNWTKNLENAAFDTYKSFMDAQWLLQDALNKANHLNTLVHLQKSGVSPTNNWKF